MSSRSRRSLPGSFVQDSSVISEESREYDMGYDADRSESVGMETRHGSSQANDEYGIELVLSTTTDRTSDTQRARDMIVPSTSRAYQHHKGVKSSGDRYRNHRSMLMGAASIDEHSVASTGRSIASRTLEPLFQPDEESETSSKSSAVQHLKSRFRKVEQAADDAWRAAKRGDLAALKRFHSEGKTDWGAEDQFRNIPLYYACHSGAIVDINVVHFLLWVTPIRDRSVLEKCKNRKNKAVMKILNDFEGSGYSSPFNGASREAMSVTPVSRRTAETVNARHEAPVELIESLDKTGGEENHSSPSHPRVASSTSAVPTKSTSRNNTSRIPPLSPESVGQTTRPSPSTNETGKHVAPDSSRDASVEERDQFNVIPSTITNTSADDDEWSMGSMFSFGKRRQERKAKDAKMKARSHLEKTLSKDFQETSKWYPNEENTRRIGEREKLVKSQPPQSSLSRKVSFDDQKEAKKLSLKHGQLSYRRSPREKLRHTEYSDNSRPPNIEFQDEELRWKIENHIATEDSVKSNVVLTIHVGDSRERVLISNCHGVCVQIHGRKMKSLMVCDCSDLNVVFDTVSHACEIVHCKNVAIQTTGICPAFALDRTKGITIWLSHESMNISNIVTSKCTEVNVSLPRGPTENDSDRTELALPERYVHQFSGGEVKSRVSSVCR